MDPNSPETLDARDPRALLDAVAALRPLARALTRDDADADDLVQDAVGVLVARRQPVRDVRAYLAGTLRRLARRARRAEARRRRREEAAAGRRADDVDPGADDLAARVDTLRVVLAELRALPRAQQRAVALRHLDGLAPDEIARREGVGAATVRAHLARGLAALRERLDRRLGGRESWCAVLAPWAGAPPGTPPGAGSAPDPPSPDAPAAVPAAAGVLAGSIAVSTATKLAVAVPLVALGAWLALDASDGALGPAAVEDARVPGAAPTPAALEGGPAAPEPVREDPVATAPDEEARPAGARAPSEPGVPFRGQALDATTGEPVPDLALLVDHGDEVHEVRTDATGAFELAEPLPPGRLTVTAAELVGEGGWHLPEVVLEHPRSAPLRVPVGPTFTLDVDVPEGIALADLAAHVLEARSLGAYVPEAPLRAGALPWVRLPFGVTLLDGDGPWRLRVVDEQGRWFGEARIHRKAGIEPVPVRLESHPRGLVELRVRGDAGAASSVGGARLVDGDGESHRAFFGPADEEGVARAVVRMLEPGRYTWSLGEAFGAAGRGVVDVVAGEVAVVEVDARVVGATFDAEVRVDATVAEELDLSNTMLVVARADDPRTTLSARVERDGDVPGRWRIPLDDLPVGEWIVGFGFVDSRLEWSPRFATVSPDDPRDEIVFARTGPTTRVRVTGVDARTGEPLLGVRAAYTRDGLELTFASEDGAGGLYGCTVPEDEETRFVVRAPGRRCVEVVWLPSRDGDHLEVELERGWSNVVRVRSSEGFAPVSGARVLVDRRNAGFTDERGVLWLEGEGPPDSIALGGDDLEVVASTLDRAEEGVGDPLGGWFLLVRAR